MNESKFWSYLKSRLPAGDYTRIESPCSPGIPDVNYALDVRDSTHIDYIHGWIELKIAGHGNFPMLGARKGLRKAQELWLAERISLGVPCVIVAYMPPQVVVWRLKSPQVAQFNAWDRSTLLCNAAYSIDRAKLRCLPLHLFV